MNAPSVVPAASPGRQICLARQPILDQDYNLVAYELLFRQAGATSAQIDNAASATLAVITNAFTNIGIKAALGDKTAYINFDAATLRIDMIDDLPSDKVVLEILESVEPDDSLLERLQELRNRNYRFALDDFKYSEDKLSLVDLVDIIKVDISQLDQGELLQHIEFGRSHNKTLLAEKVETHNQFELCKSLGFDLFQGFFFAKPVILTQSEIPAEKAQILNIMNLVMQDADTISLEKAISRDLSLSYKLLKFINSAGLTRGQSLNSISETVNMLGRKPLYRWLSLLLFTSNDDSAKQTNALFNLALYRGRLLELLGESSKHPNPNDLFILGTFSYLEALLNIDLKKILKDMALPSPIMQALLAQTGGYWPYLNIAETIDNNDMQNAALIAETLGFNIDDITEAQLSASAYSEAHS